MKIRTIREKISLTTEHVSRWSADTYKARSILVTSGAGIALKCAWVLTQSISPVRIFSRVNMLRYSFTVAARNQL